MYAGVVINKRAAALDRLFHYVIPEGMAIRPGMLVEVEFGRQKLEAVVVELTAEVSLSAELLKPIIRVISKEPLFGEDLLALSRYGADYYLCSRATLLQAMLPAGMELTGRLPKSRRKKMVQLVQPMQPEKNYNYNNEEKGGPKLRLGPKQQEVLQLLGEEAGGAIACAELEKRCGCSAATLRSLEQRGLIRIWEEEIWEGEASTPEIRPAHALTADQQRALAEIRRNFAGERKPVLLHGVTGSGKTEIYLRLAEEQRAAGKQSIILVPEIALTPQTVRVFRQRFGAGVAVLHSGLSAGERRAAWLGIAAGRYDLIIGARSALFAPTPKLGLLIIDEEHEATYKQDRSPRFHTRPLAIERCRLTGAGLVLGSATPDVESFYKASLGEYLPVSLPRRVGGEPAAVQIVDMAGEFRAGNNSIFSRALQQKLAANLQAGRQSLLFLNRRGYESFVSCRECGYVVECPHCSVAMAYHIGDEVLKCHYCEATRPVPNRCPKCGSRAIRFFGAGTQKLAEAARALLPQARIARLDRDVTAKAGQYERVYQAMLAGEIDILVGTQMIAKGLDFPNLTLVGVIAADISLNQPDLRSGERTFQLCCQVAGRAGRHREGEVILQTYQPESAIIKAAASQDYPAFYAGEIERRELAGYPPFASLIRLVISSLDLASAHAAARSLAYRLQLAAESLGAAGELMYLGPKPCPKAKIKDRHRLQILLKAKDLGLLRTVVRLAVAEVKLPHDTNIAIDVEPMSII